MHGALEFWHFMFAPTGAPWFTGAFWSNQTQWTVVWIPSLIWLVIKQKQHHKKMEDGMAALHKLHGIGVYNKKKEK